MIYLFGGQCDWRRPWWCWNLDYAYFYLIVDHFSYSEGCTIDPQFNRSAVIKFDGEVIRLQWQRLKRSSSKTSIRDMLFNLFNVTNRTYFMSLFKQRLRDQYIQQWFISVSTRSSCSLYKNITNNFWCQNYFHMVTNCNHKISNQKSFTTKCNSGQREKSQILQHVRS